MNLQPVPLYAVILARTNAAAETGIVHTGAEPARVADVVEVNGRRGRVVAIRDRTLETPVGIESVGELYCVEAHGGRVRPDRALPAALVGP